MKDAIDPQAAFDAAFARMSPSLELREERADDAAFLVELFVACSPLAGLLPAAMLEEQAAFQDAGYRTQSPHAKRRIVVRAGQPIGRAMLAWNVADNCLIDVAVLPGHRRSNAGLHLLLAWTEVADLLGQVARGHVRADNPALKLYYKLGFEPQLSVIGDSPMIEIVRQPQSRSAAVAAGGARARRLVA